MRLRSYRCGIAFVLAILAISALPSAVHAATMRIVALGASNTAGKGVSTPWPELLQQMLRARGYDAEVTNAGITGEDVEQMLARLDSAVPEGTRLVILDKGGNNAAHGVSIHPGVVEIRARLTARHIKLIVIPSMHAWAGNRLQADGLHITEQGHAAVAARLVPLVIAALGKGRH
jgi:acyl-CoA thioesterase I